MNLNDRISKIIEFSELSPSEFADEVDVQRSSISHITSGRNKPSLDFIIKIKNKFPQIQWDWLINGQGEMLIDKEEIDNSTENTKPTSLPDLFTMIDDDQFGFTESEDRISKKQNWRESEISTHQHKQKEISNSQPLVAQNYFEDKQSVGNHENKIKRIVIFYENGKFESFEQ